MMLNHELYVSVDVETNGPCPGVHSMLSLGSAVFEPDNEKPIAMYSVNLECLSDAHTHPETDAFWKNNPIAYANTRIDVKSPRVAMLEYANWLDGLPKGKRVFVGYPAAFDSLFVFWYLHKFVGRNPFGFQALDIKSYAMAVLKQPYGRTVKASMRRAWFDETRKHTHVALDDAIEQGILFIRMMRDHRGSDDSKD